MTLVKWSSGHNLLYPIHKLNYY